MHDLKILLDYFRKDKIASIIVITATFMGALLGIAAFYNEWLG